MNKEKNSNLTILFRDAAFTATLNREKREIIPLIALSESTKRMGIGLFYEGCILDHQFFGLESWQPIRCFRAMKIAEQLKNFDVDDDIAHSLPQLLSYCLQSANRFTDTTDMPGLLKIEKLIGKEIREESFSGSSGIMTGKDLHFLTNNLLRFRIFHPTILADFESEFGSNPSITIVKEYFAESRKPSIEKCFEYNALLRYIAIKFEQNDGISFEDTLKLAGLEPTEYLLKVQQGEIK